MQAFLQRIINGGGCINREYGLGRRVADCCTATSFRHSQQPLAVPVAVAVQSFTKHLSSRCFCKIFFLARQLLMIPGDIPFLSRSTR